ncbi:helix-turn-helix transcriptional regulator [Streptomyces sp. NPDC101227]|uniref:helix-turn-helix domain-containing protein n=1 Tax=Streptomyces sp. NPDC101227 TaxID=3366136 RepID=UPI0037FCFED8
MSDRVLGVVPDGGEGTAQPPAAAGMVLGNHLRQLREDRGYIMADVVAAGVIGSVSTLSRYESAKTPFQEEVVVALLKFYGTTDAGELADVRELVRLSQAKQWWAGFRDVVPGCLDRLFSMETSAEEIRTYQGFFVPGLLQTADYARAVMKAPFRKPANERAIRESERKVGRRLAVRLRRQHLLDQTDAPHYYALLDEGILNRPTGGKAVMRGQLRHLYNLAENKERINIRILPFAAAEHAAAPTSSLTLLKLPPAHGGDMVYVEATNQGGTYINDIDEMEAHRAALDDLWTLAVGKKQTLALLEQYIERLADTE